MATQPTDGQGGSTRPYLIRALHEWCTDHGFTPYLAVHVDERVQVPAEYVKNQEIVLNVGFDATQGLKLGNEVIEFRARFGGVAREIVVPVDHVVAIYARENGQGMAFPVPVTSTAGPANGPTLAVPGSAPTLRLASDGSSPDAPRIAPDKADQRGVQPAPSPPREPEDPDGRGGPGGPAPGGRPSLKRVK